MYSGIAVNHGHEGVSRHTDPVKRFPIRAVEIDRFKFGKQWKKILYPDRVAFCLDVACGAKPFPEADVLCDLNLKPVSDRRMLGLITNGKPFVLCDCRYLPFKDFAFDFATSYYLIEHLADPWLLLKELRRVSTHGYIQCPTWFSEFLYGEEVHKWLVFKRGGRLCIKPLRKNQRRLYLGFFFHRLYRAFRWRIMHAILDESFHLFTIAYGY